MLSAMCCKNYECAALELSIKIIIEPFFCAPFVVASDSTSAHPGSCVASIPSSGRQSTFISVRPSAELALYVHTDDRNFLYPSPIC